MPADLATLDALFAAATPGPWEVCSHHDGRHRTIDSPHGAVVDSETVHGLDWCVVSAADAALIAALHNAWPSLKRRLEIGDAAVEVCDLTANMRALWKAMGAGDEGAVEAYEQRLKAIDAARSRLRALREAPDAA